MRSALLTSSSKLFGAVFGVILAFSAASIEPFVSHHEAMADSESDEIAVGRQLQATEDVSISGAEIAKDSKVSITKVAQRQGDPSTVDIALADGKVLKRVGIGVIRSYFRVLGS